MYGESPEGLEPADIVVETRAENCSTSLQSLKRKEWEVIL